MKRDTKEAYCSALLAMLLAGFPFALCYADETAPIESEAVSFRIQQVAEGLQIPWAIAFLPDGNALVSERAAGRITLVNLETGELTLIEGGPEDVFVEDNAGMLDIVPHHPISYAADGRQYIAVPVGGATAEPERRVLSIHPEIKPSRGINALFVFALPQSWGRDNAGPEG